MVKLVIYMLMLLNFICELYSGKCIIDNTLSAPCSYFEYLCSSTVKILCFSVLQWKMHRKNFHRIIPQKNHLNHCELPKISENLFLWFRCNLISLGRVKVDSKLALSCLLQDTTLEIFFGAIIDWLDLVIERTLFKRHFWCVLRECSGSATGCHSNADAPHFQRLTMC